jgi:hypothetical protein
MLTWRLMAAVPVQARNMIILPAGTYTLSAVDNNTLGATGLPLINSLVIIQILRSVSAVRLMALTSSPSKSPNLVRQLEHILA